MHLAVRCRSLPVTSNVSAQVMEYFFPPGLVLFFVVLPVLMGVCAAVGGRRWGWRAIALGAGLVLLPAVASALFATSIHDGVEGAAIFGLAMGAPFLLGFMVTMLVHRRPSKAPHDR